MMERAKEVTRWKGRAVIEYARFADDMVVLVNWSDCVKDLPSSKLR
jgi:hypothetical protein